MIKLLKICVKVRLSKFKKIYFILPCPIKQIERGQVKVAFKQAIAFKKLGFIPVLINIWFKSKKEISKNKKIFFNAFDEIYGIDIYFSDLLECFLKSITQRFINQVPLQVNLINLKELKLNLET